jgi:hypothetical protein
MSPGQPFTLTDRSGVLSGVLADGSPFSVKLNSSSYPFQLIEEEALVTLTLTPIDGDFNADGFVNSEDLALWTAGYGASGAATHPQGDADHDLDVDGADFLAWQRQLSSSSAASAQTAVPEPAAFILTVIGAFQLSRWRRRPNNDGAR